ncbi:HK97-gp10 family putative phage morphogenesis protein [Mangrovicoccus ximenensis]|uniref:HK97-gp10 family putative phage morphogenesis protein n=1 Tax=Mangrovicoccus ximenensis TaxID=1911570 RepID=UPI001374F8AD|nr:HK97-gp10 family putative phage morphogenesis protein [Mangrovicoccus ximenensis]
MSGQTGAKGAAARSRQRSAALKNTALEGINRTITSVHKDGTSNIDAMTRRRTGLLRRWYRKSLRKASVSGFVGYISAKARDAAFYARFVHDGTSKADPRPFHERAVEMNSGEHSAEMRQALRDALKQAAPGSLGRTGGRSERGLE